MKQIAESELILDKRGAIYHIGAKPEEIAGNIILVGDQNRVKEVSKYFDRIEFEWQHREFITHTGFIGNKRMTVMSTGIGPDNIDIALNELDALANIDLVSRTVKPALTSLNIFRFGTSGSLQGSIPADSIVAATHGLGFDNVMHFYLQKNTSSEADIIHAFKEHTGLTAGNVAPYIYEADAALLSLFSTSCHTGITVACPGFYGPQGRVLRLGLKYPGLIDKLTSFHYEDHRIANFEMESSAIYGLSRSLGHRCLSLNVIVANRVTQQFSGDAAAAVEKLIQHSLDVLSGATL